MTARARDNLLLALWLALIVCCSIWGRLAGPYLEGPQNRARTLGLVAVAGLAGLAWAVAGLRRRPEGRRAAAGWALAGGALALGLLAWSRANHIEAVHVVVFGVLGLLCWRWAGHFWLGQPRLWAALIFGAAIGAADEFLQHLLPWRVGDWRDVFTNCLSSTIVCLLAWRTRLG